MTKRARTSTHTHTHTHTHTTQGARILTLRGDFMEPTKKMSSRAGCHTARKGVSHRPVLLLWLPTQNVSAFLDLHLKTQSGFLI